jgi:regulator of sirC expression with transglutaminase-like and TPR domain
VNTDAAVMAQIDDFDVSANRSLANGYYQASSYLYGAKKKMEMALDYATKAVELRPDTYWMHRNRALILAELGNYKEAVKAAEESTKYAVEMGNENYPKMNAASIAEWKKKK